VSNRDVQRLLESSFSTLVGGEAQGLTTNKRESDPYMRWRGWGTLCMEDSLRGGQHSPGSLIAMKFIHAGGRET